MKSTEISLSIIGLGLIGKQRLEAALDFGVLQKSISVFDPEVSEKTRNLYPEIDFMNSREEILAKATTHAIVATPHHLAKDYVSALLSKNINVLLEKPLGRNLAEAVEILDNPNSQNLSLGFNYRFMPGVIALKEHLNLGTLGVINSIRFELGHGGSPSDKESWKLDLMSAGGGSLLDPGIHLIDLLLYLFSLKNEDIQVVGATSWKGFWNTGLEESVNLIGSAKGMPFNINVSLVAWKTRFKIEIMGTDGYFEISGRGRSDGPQSTVLGKRWGWQDASSQADSEIRNTLATKDESLHIETKTWLAGHAGLANSSQALSAMQLYNIMYQSLGNR